jgi:hypothetical protein
MYEKYIYYGIKGMTKNKVYCHKQTCQDLGTTEILILRGHKILSYQNYSDTHCMKCLYMYHDTYDNVS